MLQCQKFDKHFEKKFPIFYFHEAMLKIFHYFLLIVIREFFLFEFKGVSRFFV